MVTGNRDTVEFRHVFGGVFENITDNTHGHSRRINVGVTYHELFQNIVLNGTSHDGFINALFFTGYDEECQYRQYCAVHGHGYGHLIQRNTGEQDVHIEHGANRYACFTNVTNYTRVISVIAAVSRQVERDGQTFLACSQVTTIECVRFFRSGETCILTYSPRTENIHCRVWTTQERRNTAHKVQMVTFVIDILGVQRSFRNTFQGCIIKGIIVFAHFLFQILLPFVIRTRRMIRKGYFSEIRINAHYSIIPFFFCSIFRVWKQLAFTLMKSSTPASL